MTSINAEVVVECEGELFRLVLNFGAFCLFESLTGLHYALACSDIAHGRLSASHARALTWAMSQKHHKGLTLDRAGDLLSARPSLIREAFLATQPTPDEQERLGN